MGKPKQPDPEPEKVVRTLGNNLTIELTNEEKKYRNKNGPDDISELNKEKIKCTVCAKSLADLVKKGTDPYIHMLLNVLVCKDCSSFYGDGYFSVDEDGDDKYCRWCGQGGTLYLCSMCTCAFCKKCIKLNLSKSELKELESDDWKCLFCNPRPLYECRTVCWALQEHAKEMKNKKGQEEEENESESEEAISSRTSRGRNKRNANSEESTSNSRKRKATEVSDESEEDKKRESKRVKSSNSNKKVEEPNRRSRRPSTQKSEDEKESPKKQAKTETRSRRGKEVEATPPKKPTRTMKSKPEEITISDSESDVEVLSKVKTKAVSANKSTKKVSTPKKETPSQEEKKERPKRTVVDKTTKTPVVVDSPKRPPRSASKSAESGKKIQSFSDEEDEHSSKPGPRSSKNKRSPTKSKSSKKPVNYDSSDTDNKKRSSRRRSEVKDKSDTPRTSTLPLDKNADSTVVQASVYINSALKDVRELSVLISNRCEKLCSKSVQSSEDVLTVFTKLKQMMTGVHANLELIERGLDTKINGWKIQNDEAKEADKEKTVKAEKSDSKTKGEDDLTPKSLKEKKSAVVIEDVPKNEEMEVEEVKVDKKAELEEMDVDDSQDNLLNSAINNALVSLGDDSNSNEKVEGPASKSEESENKEEEEEREADEKETVGEKKQTEEDIEAITSTESETVTSSGNNDVEEEQNNKLENDNEEDEVEDEKNDESDADEEEQDSDKEESNVGTSNKDDTEQDESEYKLESEECNEGNVDAGENQTSTNEIDEEYEADNAAADCTADTSDVERVSSIETQLPCIAAGSEMNGLSSCDEVDRILGEEDTTGEEPVAEKKEENSTPDQSLDISETDQVKSDDNLVSSSQQSKEVDELKNGTVEDGQMHSTVEEKKEEVNRNESSELRSSEKKDDSISSRTSFESQKTSPGPHPDTPRTGPPGRYPQDSHSPGYGHRGHRDGWGRGRYNRDRWSVGGGRGGSWNRYEDRRQGPPHWDWNR